MVGRLWEMVSYVGWSRSFKIDRSILQVLRINNMMITKMLLSFIKLTVEVFYDDIGCYCKITKGIYHVSQQNVSRTNKKSLPPSSSWKGDIEDITWARGDTKFPFECIFNTRREISYLQEAM